jgi:hypothetical protein
MRGKQIGPQWYELSVLGGAFGKDKKRGAGQGPSLQDVMCLVLETLLCGFGFDAVEGDG